MDIQSVSFNSISNHAFYLNFTFQMKFVNVDSTLTIVESKQQSYVINWNDMYIYTQVVKQTKWIYFKQVCGAVTFLVDSGSGSGSGEVFRLRLRLRLQLKLFGGFGSGSKQNVPAPAPAPAPHPWL